MREPKAFLFDEPLSNLDAALRVQMRLEIAQLQNTLGTTTIYVTHDQVEAMTMADKIVVLERRPDRAGRHARSSSTTSPANLFVAGFIGSPKMNFDHRRGGGRADGAATIGVRPEHIAVAARRAARWHGHRQRSPSIVGSDTFLYVDGRRHRRASRCGAPGELGVEAGRPGLPDAASPARIHRFDKEGQRPRRLSAAARPDETGDCLMYLEKFKLDGRDGARHRRRPGASGLPASRRSPRPAPRWSSPTATPTVAEDGRDAMKAKGYDVEIAADGRDRTRRRSTRSPTTSSSATARSTSSSTMPASRAARRRPRRSPTSTG